MKTNISDDISDRIVNLMNKFPFNYLGEEGKMTSVPGDIIFIKDPPAFGLVLMTSEPRYVGGGFCGYNNTVLDKILCYAEHVERIGQERKPLGRPTLSIKDGRDNLIITSQNYQVHASNICGYRENDFPVKEVKEILIQNATDYLKNP